MLTFACPIILITELVKSLTFKLPVHHTTDTRSWFILVPLLLLQEVVSRSEYCFFFFQWKSGHHCRVLPLSHYLSPNQIQMIFWNLMLSVWFIVLKFPKETDGGLWWSAQVNELFSCFFFHFEKWNILSCILVSKAPIKQLNWHLNFVKLFLISKTVSYKSIKQEIAYSI